MPTRRARFTLMIVMALPGCTSASDEAGVAGASDSSTGGEDSTGQPTAGPGDATGEATTSLETSDSSDAGSSTATGTTSSGSTSAGSSGDDSSGGEEVACTWQEVLASDRVDAANAVALSPSRVVFAGDAGDLDDFGRTTRGFLASYAFDGERQWGRQLSNQSVSVYSVAVDAQGAIIVAGSRVSPSVAWLRKFDADGVELWQREYPLASGTPSPLEVTIDSDDSIVVAGSVFSGGLFGPDEPFGSSVADPVLLRLDPSGEPVWELQVATSWYEGYRDVVIDTTGDIVVAGFTLEGTGFPYGDGLIARYDADGVLFSEMVFELDSFEEEEIEAIALGPGGDLFIAGSTTSALDGMDSAGGSDAFVARLDAGGALVWGQLFGGPDDDLFETLHVGPAGDLVVGGHVGEEGVLLRYGPDGVELDVRTLDNRVHAAVSSAAGDLFVVGRRIDPTSKDPTYGGIDASVRRICLDDAQAQTD